MIPGTRARFLFLTLAVTAAACSGGESAAPAKPPQAFWDLRDQAIQEEARGQWRAAVASYEQALVIAPNHPGANYQIAGLLDMLGKNNKALEHVQVSIANSPSPSSLYVARQAKILLNLGRAEEAGLALEKVIELEPRHRKAYPTICEVYLKLYKLDEVIETANQALKLDLDPNYPYYTAQILFSRGVAYQKKGDTESAERDLREATRICPPFPKPYFTLGNLLAKKGETEEADRMLKDYAQLNKVDEQIETIYRMVVELDQDAPRGLRELIRLHVLIGQYRHAEDLCRVLMGMEPGNPELEVMMGTVKALLNANRSAEKRYRKSIEINPTYKEAYSRLAVLYATAEDEAFRDLDAAWKVVEEARSHGGVDSQSLAQIYYAQGETERALTTLRRALFNAEGDILTTRSLIKRMEAGETPGWAAERIKAPSAIGGEEGQPSPGKEAQEAETPPRPTRNDDR